MTNISFAFADSKDEEDIRQLLSECELPHKDISGHLPHFILAQDESGLVGTVGLEVIDTFGMLRSLAVRPFHRNQGIGKALYNRALGYAHIEGIKRLYLLTITAEAYFSRLGFERIERGRTPASVQNTEQFRSLCPSTAVCMTRDIENEPHYYPEEVLRLRSDVKGASMWGVALDKTMFTYFEVEPNSRFEEHSHESEQITMVLEGVLLFESGEQVISVKEGEVIAIPSNVPHAVFTEHDPAKAVDAWSPVMGIYK
ncbi:arsenic resistance N-acetyltransferase ArsN2 [Candidatus Poribacteria bacterium]